MIDRRQLLLGGVAGMAWSLWPAPLRSQAPIRVALSLPLSGEQAELGAQLRGVYETVLGQLSGIRLEVLDDGGDPARANSHYEALAEAGVRVAIGSLGEERTRFASDAGLHALPLAVPAGDVVSRLVHSLRPSARVEAESLVAGLASAGFTNIGLIYGLDAQSRRLQLELQRASRAANLRMVELSSRPGGQAETHTRDLSTELRNRGCDVLLCAEPGAASGAMIATSRSFGWEVPAVCSSRCDLGQLQLSLDVLPGVPGRLVVARAVGLVSGSSGWERAYRQWAGNESGAPSAADSEVGLESFVQASLLAERLASTERDALDWGRLLEAIGSSEASGVDSDLRFFAPTEAGWTPRSQWTDVLTA